MTNQDPTPSGSTGSVSRPPGMASPPQPRVEGPAGVDTEKQETHDRSGLEQNQQRGQEVAGHARSEMEQTAEKAGERAHDLTETARSEVRDVVDEARDALRTQADEQSKVAAGALSRLRDDLQAMSSGDTPRDATAEYLKRAAGSIDDVVGRLEREGIEGALSGIRRFARRSPGGFLAASAGAGFAVSRLIRNADHPQQVGEQGDSDSPSSDRDVEIDLVEGPADRDRLSATQQAFADGGARR